MGMEPSELTKWYKGNAPLYLSLGESVRATIVSLLKTHDMSFVSVEFRVKTLESLLTKFSKKNYSSTIEITDLLGLRVILYLESDIDKANKIIEEAFVVDVSQSVNKSDELEDNKIGYRSNHFICELGPERLKLPELKVYTDHKFEIQVRTALQHAWAEIEHDRSYKFSGDIPKKYRRRLNLIAGTLELIDSEFSNLAADIDAYANSVPERVKTLSDEDEITSQNVEALVKKISGLKTVFDMKAWPVQNIKGELDVFNLSNIGDIKRLISKEFIQAANKYEKSANALGFLRSLMMFEDIDMYFAKAWQNSWQSISVRSLKLLKLKYGREKVLSIL